MSVTRDDVRHIASLARLDFSDEEEEEMAGELSRILDYVDELDEVDTSGVEPMSHVLDLTNVSREDEVDTRIDRDDALQNAPDAGDGFFRVPKVID
jgi:aspartyl-tRNA(Asn)/glutamyl-tRNA(Gln) amidotransferase subunit C